MKATTHPTALRIQQLLHHAGIHSNVVEFEQPTRTSAEAAAAIGCCVAEIAKSVVFRSSMSGQPIIIVTSGDNRVSEDKVAKLIGEKLVRADADFVRQSTGFAIGGVAPLGFTGPVTLLLDADLQRFTTIWAAAGTPFSVFPLSPQQLSQLTGAPWSDVKLDPWKFPATSSVL
ncbi:MAG TPA: YbaK/EbsC family protein [Burkholderiaceae bacterium]|nr:YbaK/EbsC family protein [Burkholderiaceae bacterium]